MKYIIVGAVAGGASTAARLRRLDEKAEIVLFEKGEYISYANCGLPYYIGNVIKDRNKLFVQNATSFNRRFNIDVRVKTEVLSIDATKKLLTAFDAEKGISYVENYDKLVLSPGAEPIRPPFPGINLPGIFTLRNVNDTDYIKAFVSNHPSGKSAVIIGGGFIGIEMAENLHHLGMNISIVEMGNQILAPLDYPMAALAQQHIRSKNVDILLNTAVTGFEKTGDKLQVQFKNGNTISADVVILSIGVKPDTKLASGAGLEIGTGRGILVNEYLQTSNPNIYAVGDAIEFKNPLTGISSPTFLAGPANKQGRICANNIVLNNVEKYKGAVNTAIVKVFDLTVGATGLASKNLAANNIEHLISTTHSGSHAGYYPGSKQMSIQLCFSPANGQLYGAQVVGYEGADKRLDVLAWAVKHQNTVYDLAEFEHAYAPPYSSAKDPINMAGFVADNILNQRLKTVSWNVTDNLLPENVLIDVRNENEFLDGNITGAINIPVDELRGRLSEIDKTKSIYIYCQIGLRGYLAQRILLQNGFENVKNISGGYFLWKACNAEKYLLAIK